MIDFSRHKKLKEKEYGYDGTELVKDKNGEYKQKGKTFYTIRDEMLILCYNKKGDITRIELLGSPKAKKPCQSS
jgi:hypothetical protein